LLLTAGISRQTSGAMLLLGGSMGGELLNPAAVEVTAIKTVTGLEAHQIIQKILPYNLLACGTALLMFWMLSLAPERRTRERKSQARDDQEINVEHAPGSIAAAMSISAPADIGNVNLF